MKSPVVSALILILVLVGVATSSRPLAGERAAPRRTPDAAPTLLHTCLITKDVGRLAAFYAQILQMDPHKDGDDYVEFRTGVGVLALFAADAQERYIPGSAIPGQNHSAILEFRVADVDREYARLHGLVKTWVKGPTTQPWGTRSIYFRDPDGNLVDFFAPATRSPQHQPNQ